MCQQRPHLMTPRPVDQREVRGYDGNRMLTAKLRRKRRPLLEPAHVQVDREDGIHWPARQQCVAQLAATVDSRCRERYVIVEASGELEQRIRTLERSQHFLKRDDIGVELFKDGIRQGRQEPRSTRKARPSVHVIGSNPQVGRREAALTVCGVVGCQIWDAA